MDAENRVDGEDGKPENAGESSSAPAQGEDVSPNPEPRADAPAGQAILLGTGESAPETPETPAEEPEPPEAAPEVQVRPLTGETVLTAIALDQVDEDDTFRIRPEG